MKHYFTTLLFAAAALLSLASCSKEEKDEEPQKTVDPIVGTWQVTRWHGLDDVNEPFDYTLNLGEKSFVFQADGALTEMTRMPDLDYDDHYRWERNTSVEGTISVFTTEGEFSGAWVVTLSEGDRHLSIFRITGGFSSTYECTRK